MVLVPLLYYVELTIDIVDILIILTIDTLDNNTQL